MNPNLTPGSRVLVLLAVLLLLAFAPFAAAQSGENVLLVVNQASETSVRIGDYYARTRRVPPDNILRISVAIKDEVTRADYERQIEASVVAWFGRTLAHDRIVYIVLTKGVPLRVAGSSGRGGTLASVDSELALLYRKMTGERVSLVGPLPNPYFLGDQAPEEAQPFSHREQDVFLVTRLDSRTTNSPFTLMV